MRLGPPYEKVIGRSEIGSGKWKERDRKASHIRTASKSKKVTAKTDEYPRDVCVVHGRWCCSRGVQAPGLMNSKIVFKTRMPPTALPGILEIRSTSVVLSLFRRSRRKFRNCSPTNVLK